MKLVKTITFVACLCAATLSAKNLSVIGVGRLGLPFSLILERAGYNVLGVDVLEEYVNQINDKTLNSPEPQLNEYLRESLNFRATTSLKEAIEFSDVYILCVPTNTVPGLQSYDHSIISYILNQINSCRVSDKHIVINSTVFPEYIEKEAKNLIPDCTNTTISYNPEFVAQGDVFRGFLNPDVVLIGEANKEIGDFLEEMHRKTCHNMPYIARMSPTSAEISKLALNCFVTSKIAFANFIGELADSTEGADKLSILKAVGQDSRIGVKYFRPGYGYGGTCFPRDNRALGNFAETKDLDPIIFRTTDEANKRHALFMAEQFLAEGLDEYFFEDVCFKPHSPVPIIEESQKLAVAKHIADAGKKVVIKDYNFIISEVRKEYGDVFEYIEVSK